MSHLPTEQSETFRTSYPILGGGFFLAGRASGEVKRRLSELGLPAELLRRVVIATYEAEMNIVIHAVSGEIIVQAEKDCVRVTAADRGPGIADIEQAMRPGFSTASEKARSLGFGAGMGLVNMQRCADRLDISSEVYRGTRIEMSFCPRPGESKEG
ncbi:MAG: ATP-binding protein [Armatimonadota bacterium]